MIKLSMRTDEEYAKNSIKAYLKSKFGFAGDIVEGEDPPDYYVLDGDKKIALEITRAESIFGGESRESRKKTSTEAVAMLCDELNEELKNLVPPEKSLMLVFKTPIYNFGKFKKRLRLMLKELLQEADLSNKALNINGEIVEVKWVTDEKGDYKGIVGAIGDKDPIIKINEQVRLIMERIISEKEVQLKEINGKAWSGEKWLGIINNYPLAEHTNFSQVLQEITVQHDFSKIFFIGGNSAAVEIFQKLVR